jgi:hypothetical protein
MSATEIPSGRGRLRMPGMGQSIPERGQPAAPAPDSDDAVSTPRAATPAASADPTPTQRPRRRTPSVNGAGAESANGTRAAAPATKRRAKTIDGPYADEKKAQVNPRVYPSIWSHYEDLVEELPRHQRRGALTALVNAVLAQHAPATTEEAQEAIQWLREAETRERPA